MSAVVSGNRISLEAEALRTAYDREGLSNPIGTFTCPHCQQVADVEYATPYLELPSGTLPSLCTGGTGLDAARCFQCCGVSYWLITDFDLHNNDGRDWRDFPRVLLYPRGSL